MMRTFSVAMLALVFSPATVRAQYTFIGAGSTPQGDYLRGVGIAGYGLGAYNEQTAIAGQINTQTFMMLNDYMLNLARNESLEYAARRSAQRAKNTENYRKIHDRIYNNPEAIDVLNGSALNAKLWELLDPKVSDSASRLANVPLAPDLVRCIPFKLAEKGETFSMNRLLLKGKNWAVPFQDPSFAALRREYEHAVDNALELAIDGTMKDSAIDDVEKAVEELDRKLRSSPHLLEPEHQREANEGREQLDRLRKTARLFMTFKVQKVLQEIDSYQGTTVDDFRLFMQRHKLTFARTDSPDERSLYPKLYTALLEHRDKVVVEVKDPGK
jgi:hypothetical protein